MSQTFTPSLSLAIRNRATSVAQAQNTYQTNVVAVNTLVTSVLSSQLPTLNQNPPDWSSFVSTYEEANAAALTWVNTVMARLLDVPGEVDNYNPIISQLLQDAQAQAAKLESQPGDSIALQALNNDLHSLSSQLNLVTTFISGAVTAIRSFQEDLPELASDLASIAAKSAADAQADQDQIDQLNADIEQLHQDIKSLTAAIVGLGIADAAAITLGLVATIAAWPVGAVAWLVLGPAVAVATTYIALDAEKIKADNAKIAADQQEIQGLTADVATLSLLAKNYGGMATQAQEIEDNLSAVLSEWQTLESDVNEAITDIRTATSDSGAANFSAVASDLSSAVDEWNAAYSQAGSLKLDLKVNNAQLRVGMSSDEVQSALANGQTVDIIDYYNQVQLAA